MNEKNLEDYLKDKPKEVAAAIAARAALRAAQNLPMKWDRDRDPRGQMIFVSFRYFLILSWFPTINSDDARVSAGDLALFAARTASDSALFAVRSAADTITRSATDSEARSVLYIARSEAYSILSAARSAGLKIWREVEWDMQFVESSQRYDGTATHDGSINYGANASALIEQKLFNNDGNDWAQVDFERLNKLAQEHPDYIWWVNWLKAMHDGTFRNWDLAEKIALLPDEDWEKGAAHIAQRIREFTKDEDKQKAKNLENQVETLLRHSARAISTNDDFHAVLASWLDEFKKQNNNWSEFPFVLVLEQILTIVKNIGNALKNKDADELSAQLLDFESRLQALMLENERLALACETKDCKISEWESKYHELALKLAEKEKLSLQSTTKAFVHGAATAGGAGIVAFAGLHAQAILGAYSPELLDQFYSGWDRLKIGFSVYLERFDV